jgi:hypothetical protein
MHKRQHKLASTLALLAITATMITGCSSTNTDVGSLPSQEKTTNGATADTQTDMLYETTDENQSDYLPDDSKIIKNAYANITARDFDAADKKLDELVKQYSVRVISNRYGSDSNRNYELNEHDIIMRVKSEDMDACIAAIKGIDAWSVQNIDVSADDIGEQYQSNQARIESLRIRYDFYKQQAENATTEEEIRAWTEKMLDTTAEIEQLENQNKQIDTDVVYSTINISLMKDTSADEMDTSKSVWQTLTDTLAALPGNILSAFGYVLIVIVWVLPYALIIAIVMLIAKLISKKYRETHPKPETPSATPQKPRRAQNTRQQTTLKNNSDTPKLPTIDKDQTE